MSKREFNYLGLPVYFSEVELFDFRENKDKEVIKPFFLPVWNDRQNCWNFRSKKSGKWFSYTDLLAQHGPFWKENFERLEKASRHEMSSVFFSHWAKMVLYYNSFERYEEALKEYVGKPKGRDDYAALEREKWFLKFKEV